MPDPLKSPVSSSVPAPPARPGRMPLELEMEFAEMQATAPAGGMVPALLGAGLLFHALLIAERAFLSLPPAAFALRGGPVTLLLILLLLLPAATRQRESGRAFLVLFNLLLVLALLADVPFTGAQQLLPMQTGVALLLLLLGWLSALPRRWAVLAAGATLVADAAALVLGPATHLVGLPIILESFWAPAFAAALLVLLATVRHNEARRDFLLMRQAAFAGVPQGEATAESRHLDPETGVGNRLAFDMRFRAAWDQAANRRNSVALLFFSIGQLCGTEARFRLSIYRASAESGRRPPEGQSCAGLTIWWPASITSISSSCCRASGPTVRRKSPSDCAAVSRRCRCLPGRNGTLQR